jgi:hypothetical protein
MIPLIKKKSKPTSFCYGNVSPGKCGAHFGDHWSRMSTDERKYVGAQDTNHSIKLADEFFENVAKFEQWGTT